MNDRIEFNKNYTYDGRWYFVFGISFVPSDYKFKWALTFELGFWHIEMGIGGKL